MTDPSFHAQLITFTAPMVGNYGVSADAMESDRVHARAAIMREAVNAEDAPSAEGGWLDWLRDCGVAGHHRRRHARARPPHPRRGRDARRRLPGRDGGGRGARADRRRAADDRPRPRPRGDAARGRAPSTATAPARTSSRSTRASRPRSCATSSRAASTLELLPCTTPADEVLARGADGIFLVPGPGRPRDARLPRRHGARRRSGRMPVFGICLGHQLLSQAVGLETFKLPFGHRGGNHPVKDLRTGRIAITVAEPRLRGARRGRAAAPDRLRGGGADAREPLRRHDRGHPAARRPGRLRPVPPGGRARARTTPSACSTSSSREIEAGAPCLGATTSTRSSSSARARS